MAAESHRETPQRPSLCRMVIYRSKHGVDMAAVITGLVQGDDDAVHLHLFPPPGQAADAMSYEWGVAMAEPDEPRPGTWRWPERVK